MHKSSSSSTNCSKCSQVPLKKRKQSSRNPLRDVVNTNGTNCSSSSSSSIEAPSGCLRFFLPHTSTKSPLPDNRRAHVPSSTPKSAPVSRPSHSRLPPHSILLTRECSSSKHSIVAKPVSQKPEKVKKGQSKRNHYSRSDQGSFLGSTGSTVCKLDSAPIGLLKQRPEPHSTPVRKLVTGSGLDCIVVSGSHMVPDNEYSNTSSSKSKTPPVQASLSPEIECGSNVPPSNASTPACYGAGYVVSGVTDRRKCRPRGLLAVGDDIDSSRFCIAKALDVVGYGDGEAKVEGILRNSSVTLVPSPAEASMHWLLSPCHEDDEDEKDNYYSGAEILDSPLSDLGFSVELCNISGNGNSATNSIDRRRSSLLSPCELNEFQGCLGSIGLTSPNSMPCSWAAQSKEEREYRFDVDGGTSPFSIDTLGSENIMQTPESGTNSGRPVGLSYVSTDGHIRETLCPDSHESVWSPTNSSFQFDCLAAPSIIIDRSQFQNILNDQPLCMSESAKEDLSKSHVRISWREGLVSRIYEMDEFDNCRCLSDEQVDLNTGGSDTPKFKRGNGPNMSRPSGSADFVDVKEGIAGKNKEMLPSTLLCSCAESISTDGGGLARSEDSDWSLCYKNGLFEV